MIRRLLHLPKQVLFLVAASVVLSVLVLYAFSALMSWEAKKANVNRLTTRLDNNITTAESTFLKYKSDESSISLEANLIEQLKASVTFLNALYDGKPTSAGQFDKPSSEDRKELIKLAIVAVEKLSDQLKAKDVQASAQLEVAKTSHKKIIEDYRQELEDAQSFLRILVWTTAILLIAFFVLLIVASWLKLTRDSQKLSTAEAKVEHEAKRVEKLAHFIEAVASGDYNMQLDENSNDELNTTLAAMRNKLKKNSEDEQLRNWSTTGLAKIGEILRETSNATLLYDNVIKFLVKYTSSNQGGLFVLNDTDSNSQYLELLACYAFERKKYLTKKVDIGQGLVGQCFLEKERIHLTELPDEYVRITSGLGGDKPNSCLMVPLKTNDNVFGVIELASFKTYSESTVDLVEKFAESIASTISSVKINETTKLLLEQTRQQAEEMRSQEEEMRQNMEELSATQEQMTRQMLESEELKGQLQAREKVFGASAILSESDLFGNITYLNDKFAEVSKYSRTELMGRNHNIVRHPDMPKELFQLFWNTIKKGDTFQGVIKNKAKDGSAYWVDATVVPIRNKEGEIIKYISARYYIKDSHVAEQMYAVQAQRLGLPELQLA